MKLKELEIGVLKDYDMNVRLKENNQPVYFHSRKLPVHLLPVIPAKLNKMSQQGILEKTLPGR